MLRHPQALVSLAIGEKRRRLGGTHVLISERSDAFHKVYGVVVPFPNDEMDGLVERPVALIRLIDPRQSESKAERLLQDFYRLTRAEASVADLVAKGIAPKQVARLLSIAPSTVRTHLNRVVAKTGVTRQAELAHLVRGLTFATSGLPTSAWLPSSRCQGFCGGGGRS
jgi:DNA-binding CsgD family transcriptional regulator